MSIIEMIFVVVVFAVVAVILYLATDPEWMRSQARAERDLHAVRLRRELNELRQAIRRDEQRLCAELDAEFDGLDE